MMFGGVAIPQGHSTWRTAGYRRNPRGWYLTKLMAQYRSNRSQPLTNHVQRATNLHSLHLYSPSCQTITVTCWPSIDNLQQLLTQPWSQEKESSSQAVRSGSSRVDTTRPHRPNHPGSTSDGQDCLTLSGLDDGGIATTWPTPSIPSPRITHSLPLARSQRILISYLPLTYTPFCDHPIQQTQSLYPKHPERAGNPLRLLLSSALPLRPRNLTSFPPITTLTLNFPSRAQLPRHRNPLGYTPRISAPSL